MSDVKMPVTKVSEENKGHLGISFCYYFLSKNTHISILIQGSYLLSKLKRLAWFGNNCNLTKVNA